MVPLPPFTLHRVLGRGGMGEVWEGVHDPTGTPVAVKLLLPERLARKDAVEAFRREVEAVAALDHPGIVAIYDHGIVGDGTALTAGAHYLAMELVRGTPLAAHPLRGWAPLARMLDGILEALGHAHARGVIHRDLKPENVLVEPDGAPKLVDFGIAAIDREARHGRAGTPAFMAPEQMRGAWRDEGPWTDLYALGVLAWERICGVLPYDAATQAELKTLVLDGPPPRFQPRMVVPDGCEAWLRGLLARHAADRPPSAAAARIALAALGDAAEDAPLVPIRSASGTTGRATWGTVDLLGEEPVNSIDGRIGTAWPAPQIPDDWRDERAIGAALVGAGLGLWGVRDPPFVGRQAERDRLWSFLRWAAEGAPEVGVIVGGPGEGRSRLLGWLAERASEVGVAVIRCIGDDLAGALRRLARADGLPAQAAAAQVDRALERLGVGDPVEREAIAEAVVGSLPGGSRADAWRRLVISLAESRPVLICSDDPTPGSDVGVLAKALLQSRRLAPVRVLVAIACGNDAIDAFRLTALGASRVDLPPLDDEDVGALVSGMLGVDGGLLDRLVERVGGNPQFAVQIVDGWIRSGQLSAGRTGLALDLDAILESTDLVGALTGQIERLTARLSPDRLAALEIAAVLGMDVDDERWGQACEAGGVEPSEDLVELLVRERIAIREPGGFSFRHGALREAIIEASQRAGTAPARHLAVARGVRLMREFRRCEHLLDAGELREAAQRASDGWTHSEFDVHWRSEIVLLQRIRTALEAVAPPEDPLVVGLVCRVGMARMANAELEEAEIDLRHSLKYAVPGTAMFANAQLSLARIEERRGLIAEARARLMTIPFAENPRLRWARIRGLCALALHTGQFEEAAALMADLSDLEGALVPHEYAALLNHRGEVARGHGDLDTAERLYLQAHAIESRDRHSHDVLLSEVNLGLIAVARGQFERADPLFERVLHQAERRGAVLALLGSLAGLVACATADLDRWDRMIARYQHLHDEMQVYDPDFGKLLEAGGDRIGEPSRARRAWELALMHFDKLERTADAERVRSRLGDDGGRSTWSR